MTRTEYNGGGSAWKADGVSPEIEEARAVAGITSLDSHYRTLARSQVVEVAPTDRCPHSTCKVIERSRCSLCREQLGEQLPIRRPNVPLSEQIKVNAAALCRGVRSYGRINDRLRKREPDPMAGRGTTPETQIKAFFRAVDSGIRQSDPLARPIDDDKLRALWSERLSNVAIATHLGVSRETVRQRAAVLGLKRDPEGYLSAREARRRLGDRVASLKPHAIHTENGRRARHVFAIADVEKLKQETNT